MRLKFFLLAVTLSGAAGLMYQTLWVRRLGFVFGNTTLSISLVLSSFFFGLAFGGWFFGSRADRTRSPLRLYRNLELGIAASALMVWLLLPLLDELYVLLYRELLQRDLVLVQLSKTVLTFALLLAPTFLMGGTLPVMVRAWVRSRERFAASLGLIYALNTLGALVGLLAMAFLLIELLGLGNAHAAAVFISLCSAGLAGLQLRSSAAADAPSAAREGDESAHEPAAGDEAIDGGKAPRKTWLFLLSFVLGALALGLEVIWVRLWSFISLHSDETAVGYAPAELSSTYVFSSILALYLLGITLGGLWVKRLRRARRRPLRGLAWVQLLIGLLLLATLLLEQQLFLDGLALKLLEISLCILPVTVLMGVGFPLLASAFVDSVARAGRQFGAFYALNTLGCSVGPLVTGMVLIPRWGTYNCLAVFAGLSLIVAALLGLSTSRRLPTPRRRFASWAVAVAGAFALVSVVLRPLSPALPDGGPNAPTVLFEDDNHAGHTLVLEYPDGTRAVSVNNHMVSRSSLRGAFGALTIQIPAALQGRIPEDVLILCVGAGGSWVATLPYDSSVTAVDINPAVFAGLELIYPAAVHAQLQGEGMTAVVNDARNYLLLDDRTYDLINIDPAPPISQPGMVNLHTVEFYELARSRLKPGGILYQRLSVTVDSEWMYRSLLRSIAEVFPHVTVWTFLGGGVDVVASETPQTELYGHPDLIHPILFENAEQAFVFGREELNDYVAGVPPVTDDRPVLEFHLLKRLAAARAGEAWKGEEGNREEMMSRRVPMTRYLRKRPGQTAAGGSAAPDEGN